jgi:hypothetical protein
MGGSQKTWHKLVAVDGPQRIQDKGDKGGGEQSNMLTVLDIRACKVLTSSYNIFLSARGVWLELLLTLYSLSFSLSSRQS